MHRVDKGEYLETLSLFRSRFHMQTRDTSRDNLTDQCEWAENWRYVENQLRLRFPTEERWLKAFHICYAHWKKYDIRIIGSGKPGNMTFDVMYVERERITNEPK